MSSLGLPYFVLVLCHVVYHCKAQQTLYVENGDQFQITCTKPDTNLYFCDTSAVPSCKTIITEGRNITHFWTVQRASQTGQLYCRDNLNKVTSTVSIVVYHLEHPVIEPRDDPLIINEGDTLIMNCSVDSSPNVTMTWSFPRDIDTSEETLFKELVIEDVEYTDTGVYECSAFNHKLRRKSSKFINVSVLAELRLGKGQKTSCTVYFKPGVTIYLEVFFIANPPPEILWIKVQSDQPISKNPRASIQLLNDHTELTIQNSVPEDAGLYIVQIIHGKRLNNNIQVTVNVTEMKNKSEKVTAKTTEVSPVGLLGTGEYIGIGSGIAVVLIVLVVTGVSCRKYRQRVDTVKRVKTAKCTKTAKSLSELSMARRRPEPPPRSNHEHTNIEPRYSSQMKSQKKTESYEDVNQGGGEIYQQDLYEELHESEYCNQ